MVNLVAKFINICDYRIVINNSTRPFNFVAEKIKILDSVVWEIIKNHANEK